MRLTKQFPMVVVIAGLSLVGLMLDPAEASLSPQSKLDLSGIEEIRVGMTIEQASQASGLEIQKQYGASYDQNACYFTAPITPQDLKISLMVHSDRINTPDSFRRLYAHILGAFGSWDGI